jgi:hypothetical protein
MYQMTTLAITSAVLATGIFGTAATTTTYAQAQSDNSGGTPAYSNKGNVLSCCKEKKMQDVLK